jgi:hypothetical protein
MKNTIKSFQNFLNENKETDSYSNTIEFKTLGDYEIEIEDLYTQLDIINKYFPFKSVSGIYDTEVGVNLKFDNGIQIKGKFIYNPLFFDFIVDFMIKDKTYDFIIYPVAELGGLNSKRFEEEIKKIYEIENFVSIVIANQGYAAASITINKNDIENYKILLVDGVQVEGKRLDDEYRGTNQIIKTLPLYTRED